MFDMTDLNRIGPSCVTMGVVLAVAAGCGGKTDFVGDTGVDSTMDPADTGGEDAPPMLTWARTFAEELNEGSSIRQVADGGYIVAATIGYANDAWILKLDENGNIVWQKSYGGYGYDGAVSIRQMSDGGYVAACDTLSFGAGEADYWILRLDAAGNVIWQKTYGGPGAEYVAAIDETRDGGFVVAGTSSSFDPNSGVWVLKLGADGSVEWESLYSPMATGISIRQTSDGGYVALAETLSYGVGATALLLFRLDAGGAVLWQKLYSASSWQAAGNVLETLDGGYVLTGYVDISEERFCDITVLRLDGSGNILWQKAYGGDEDDRWSWINPTSDGGYVVSGGSSSFRRGGEGHDAWIFKLDADGNIAWQKVYGGDDEDELDIVQQTADGGYVAAGATFSFGPGSPSIWVLKMDPWGNIDDCPSGMIKDSDATAVSPDIYQQDGYLTAVPTTATVVETTAAPFETSTATDQQCGG
jgi:hypothetical protein